MNIDFLYVKNELKLRLNKLNMNIANFMSCKSCRYQQCQFCYKIMTSIFSSPRMSRGFNHYDGCLSCCCDEFHQKRYLIETTHNTITTVLPMELVYKILNFVYKTEI